MSLEQKLDRLSDLIEKLIEAIESNQSGESEDKPAKEEKTSKRGRKAKKPEPEEDDDEDDTEDYDDDKSNVSAKEVKDYAKKLIAGDKTLKKKIKSKIMKLGSDYEAEAIDELEQKDLNTLYDYLDGLESDD